MQVSNFGKRRVGRAALLLVLFCACADEESGPLDAGVPDSGVNTTIDAGTDGGATADASFDAGGSDAGVDGGVSLPIDAGQDAGDAGVSLPPVDAGVDSGFSLPPIDASIDAEVDAGAVGDAGGLDGGRGRLPVGASCSTFDCEFGLHCDLATCDGAGTCMTSPRIDECPAACTATCGCDGRRYCNECVAQASGVAVDPESDCPGTCPAMEAIPFGLCPEPMGLGFFWNGSRCEELIGCGCLGTDCLRLFRTREACIVVHEGCD